LRLNERAAHVVVADESHSQRQLGFFRIAGGGTHTRSGVCAATGYAEEAKLPLRMGLIRNHYVGRTFIQPQQSIRHFGVKVKLNPVRSILEGKRVVLLDDSLVRGTTSRKIVKMVKAAGASEVHLRISCPPTIAPCFYGVDTPSRAELIASTHTIDEIRKYVGADSLA